MASPFDKLVGLQTHRIIEHKVPRGIPSPRRTLAFPQVAPGDLWSDKPPQCSGVLTHKATHLYIAFRSTACGPDQKG
jgi:hypothetical protein